MVGEHGVRIMQRNEPSLRCKSLAKSTGFQGAGSVAAYARLLLASSRSINELERGNKPRVAD
jgi:hypothetical protein